MQFRTRKQLDEIRDAAAFILDRTRGLSSQVYENDRLLRQAVERNFEIIGEAMNRLRKDDPSVASQVTDADRIVAFRNVLIHGYDSVNLSTIWNTIQSDLPTLRHQLANIPPG